MTVLIVEDHPLYAQSLSQHFLKNLYAVAWAKSFPEFTNCTAQMEFDIAFVDLMLNSGYDGFDVCDILRKNFPKTKIIILSTFDEDFLLTRANRMKVDGYIVKSADFDEISKAIDLVMNGQVYYSPQLREKIERKNNFFERNMLKLPLLVNRQLTDREHEVIKHIVLHEHDDESVASALNISAHTVRDHKKKIYQKLDVHDIVGLIKFYYSHLKSKESPRTKGN